MPVRVMLSVDDGHKSDMRVLQLFEKYGLLDCATFYIAPYNPRMDILNRNEIKEIARKAELGGHTVTHRVLTKLSKSEQIGEIMEGNRILEEIGGKKIVKFAPPRGWYNEEVIRSIEECGITFIRTMKQGTIEYHPFSFIVPITVHSHPSHIENWQLLLNQAKDKEKGYFHLTCHSWELDRFDLWDDFEEILNELSKTERIC